MQGSNSARLIEGPITEAEWYEWYPVNPGGNRNVGSSRVRGAGKMMGMMAVVDFFTRFQGQQELHPDQHWMANAQYAAMETGYDLGTLGGYGCYQLQTSLHPDSHWGTNVGFAGVEAGVNLGVFGTIGTSVAAITGAPIVAVGGGLAGWSYMAEHISDEDLTKMRDPRLNFQMDPYFAWLPFDKQREWEEHVAKQDPRSLPNCPEMDVFEGCLKGMRWLNRLGSNVVEVIRGDDFRDLFRSVGATYCPETGMQSFYVPDTLPSPHQKKPMESQDAHASKPTVQPGVSYAPTTPESQSAHESKPTAQPAVSSAPLPPESQYTQENKQATKQDDFSETMNAEIQTAYEDTARYRAFMDSLPPNDPGREKCRKTLENLESDVDRKIKFLEQELKTFKSPGKREKFKTDLDDSKKPKANPEERKRKIMETVAGIAKGLDMIVRRELKDAQQRAAIKRYCKELNHQIEHLELEFQHTELEALVSSPCNRQQLQGLLMARVVATREAQLDFQRQLKNAFRTASERVTQYRMYAHEFEGHQDALSRHLTQLCGTIARTNKRSFGENLLAGATDAANLAAILSQDIRVEAAAYVLSTAQSLLQHYKQERIASYQQEASYLQQRLASNHQYSAAALEGINQNIAVMENIKSFLESSPGAMPPEAALKCYKEGRGHYDETLTGLKKQRDRKEQKKKELEDSIKANKKKNEKQHTHGEKADNAEERQHKIEGLEQQLSEVNQDITRLEGAIADTTTARGNLACHAMARKVIEAPLARLFEKQFKYLETENRREDAIYNDFKPEVKENLSQDDWQDNIDKIFNETCDSEKSSDQCREEFIQRFLKVMRNKGVTKEQAGEIFDSKLIRAGTNAFIDLYDTIVYQHSQRYSLQDQLTLAAMGSANFVFEELVKTGWLSNYFHMDQKSIETTKIVLQCASQGYSLYSLCRDTVFITDLLIGLTFSKNLSEKEKRERLEKFLGHINFLSEEKRDEIIAWYEKTGELMINGALSALSGNWVMVAINCVNAIGLAISLFNKIRGNRLELSDDSKT